MLDCLPQVPEQVLGEITFVDWKAALGKAKTASMRGICGWLVNELRRLPEVAVLPVADFQCDRERR